MMMKVEVDRVPFEVHFNSWLEGSYRRGSRFEQEEHAELRWEIDEVRDEYDNIVDDPEILQSIEDACLLLASDIDQLCAERYS